MSKETCEHCGAAWWGTQEHSLRECRDNLSQKLRRTQVDIEILLIKMNFGKVAITTDTSNPRAELPVGQRRAGVPRRKSSGRRR